MFSWNISRYWLEEPLPFLRVIRLWQAARWHVPSKWPFYYMEGTFCKKSRDPQVRLRRDHLIQNKHKILHQIRIVPRLVNFIWCPGNWRTGRPYLAIFDQKTWKNRFSVKISRYFNLLKPWVRFLEQAYQSPLDTSNREVKY